MRHENKLQSKALQGNIRLCAVVNSVNRQVDSNARKRSGAQHKTVEEVKEHQFMEGQHS